MIHTSHECLVMHRWCSIAELCPTLCDLMNCTLPGSLSSSISQILLKFMSTESVMPFNHHLLSHPLLFLPSIFPSIRVLSNESALYIKWPKYWSFSFSISPSNEYLGLISFRIDWFHLFGAQGTLKHRSLLYFYHGRHYFMVVDRLILTALCHRPLVVLVIVRLFGYSSSSLLLNVQYIPGWEGTSLSIITVLLRLCAVVTSCRFVSSILLQQ